MFNTFEKIEVSISAIRAFNDLLSAAVLQGDDMRHMASGMYALLDTQVEALATASGEVRTAFTELDKQSTAQRRQSDPRQLRASFIHDKIAEGYDAGEVAQALNLKKETVEKVIRKLLGSDASDVPSQEVRSAS